MVAIEDKQAVYDMIIKSKPNFVINTTAFHNVKECENNPLQSYLINCISLKPLIDACNDIDAVFVHFSTNYVFGGDNKMTPYSENDNTLPTNIYGLSKLSGERLIETYSKKYFIFRVSGLFGLKGSSAKKYKNFVEFMIHLGMNNTELSSNNEERFSFTSTLAISRVLEKLLLMESYGIYHLTSIGDCTRMEFAEEIFNLLKIECKLNPVTSSFFKPGFVQPIYTVLDCSKLYSLNIILPHWKESLAEYLELRKLTT